MARQDGPGDPSGGAGVSDTKPLALPATERKNVPVTRVRGKPFAKGNPGRPKGKRNKVTMLAEHLVQDDAADIVKSVISAAKRGNGHAIAAVMNIICPPRRGRSVRINIGHELDGTAASPSKISSRCSMDSSSYARAAAAITTPNC
jgi:hypothetical protein